MHSFFSTPENKKTPVKVNKFGPETSATLEEFQFDNNLELTGILGPPVWQLLYEKGCVAK